jgi:hypothetical protein
MYGLNTYMDQAAASFQELLFVLGATDNKRQSSCPSPDLGLEGVIVG